MFGQSSIDLSRSIRDSLLIGICFALFCVGAMLAFETIYGLWVGDSLQLSFNFAVGMSLYPGIRLGIAMFAITSGASLLQRTSQLKFLPCFFCVLICTFALWWFAIANELTTSYRKTAIEPWSSTVLLFWLILPSWSATALLMICFQTRNSADGTESRLNDD